MPAPYEDLPLAAEQERLHQEWRTSTTGTLVKVDLAEEIPDAPPHLFDFGAPQRRRVGLIAGIVAAAIGVLAIVIGLLTSGGGGGSADLARGVSLQEAGQLDAAAAIYREVLAEDPTDVVANYNLGVIAHTRGDLSSAATQYQQVLSIDPRHLASLYNYALLQAGTGQVPAAVDLYRRAIAVQPDHAPSLLNLGVLLLEQGGNEAEASDLIARAVRIDPSLQGS
jgi:tetratricopeptide (TPR) repeat protein